MAVDMNALNMDVLARIVCLIMLVTSVKGTKIEKRPILKYTHAQRSFTILCTADGNPAPELIMANHPKRLKYEVTINQLINKTAQQTDGRVNSTRKLEYMYSCDTPAFNLKIKCCTIRSKTCALDNVTICEENTTTANTTTAYDEVHINNTDHRKTREWFLPIIIGGGVVAVIVAVIITVVIYLSKRKASIQQGPEEMERFKRQADTTPDTSIYIEVKSEETIASHIQASGSRSNDLGLHDLGSDSVSNELGSDNSANKHYSDSTPKEHCADSALNENNSEIAPNDNLSDSISYENIMERTTNMAGPRCASSQHCPESGLNQLKTDVDCHERVQINRK